MPPHDPIADLRRALSDATVAVGAAADDRRPPTLERPPKADLGDYSTNAAMLLAPQLGQAPREVAELLTGALSNALGERAERIEVAGPGFVNLFLGDPWHREAVAGVLSAERFGGAAGTGERVLLEFVSANPTGPLTVAAGRGAAYGDSLARLLAARGAEVSREYYMNDAGSQIRSFAASIAARMRGAEPPEDGYSGAYVSELARDLSAAGAEPDDLDGVARSGVEAMRARIEATLERFGVRFDTWFSERSLHEQGAVAAIVEELTAAGHAYVSDGATWLRTTAFEDDKDRVLIRSDGEPTYFVADIAYHRDKLSRGAELMITPIGADHHGYVPRMKAAMAALGFDPGVYEAPIMQLVNIVEGGERARMSKRRGEFVALDELIDDIGADAARWFLVQRSHDTALDLDLDLARRESQDNPVYYVQYAHARIAGILAKAADEGGPAGDEAVAAAALSEPAVAADAEPSERELIRRLLELPEEVEQAALRRAPHRLCAYATALAADFHAFYRDCRVVGVDAEQGTDGLEAARLGVCLATKRVIASTLELLGIGAPERM